MANRYEPNINKGSISDILQLLEGFSSGHQRVANKGIAFRNQLNNVSSLEQLNNILPAIQDYNESAEISGNNEYIIDVQGKKDIFTNADYAFNQAKLIQDTNMGDPDELMNNIMGMSWEDAAKEINRLDNLGDAILTGTQSGYKYKTSTQDSMYSGTSLTKAIAQRKNALMAKNHIWKENEGKFLVTNDDGSLDDVSKAIWEDMQYYIISGDAEGVSKKLQDGVTHASQQFKYNENVYNKYLELQQKMGANVSPTSNTTIPMTYAEATVAFNDGGQSGVQLFGDMAGSSKVIDPGWVQQRIDDSRTKGMQFNSQHEVLTGKLYDDRPLWSLEPNVMYVPGLDTSNSAQKTDSNNRIEVEPEIGDYVPELDDEGFAADSPELDDEGFAADSPELELRDFDKSEPVLSFTDEKGNILTEEGLDKPEIKTDPINEEADADGIDFGKITTGVILAGAAASNETVQNIAKAMYKATKDGAKYLSTAYNLSAKDINYIMESINNPKGNLNKALKRIGNLEEQLNRIGKDTGSTRNVFQNKKWTQEQINKKKSQIKSQINKIRKNMVDSTVRILNKGGSNVKPEDIWRIMQNKEMSRWNPIKIKDYFMNKAPEATRRWSKTSYTAGIGKTLLRYRTGAAIKDALGIDIGEGFIANTAEDIATTAAATGALNQAGNWVIPKLKRIATSPKGKKALIKFLGKQAGKFLVKQAAGTSVPLVGNVAMAVVGAGLSISDFINFVKNFKE